VYTIRMGIYSPVVQLRVPRSSAARGASPGGPLAAGWRFMAGRIQSHDLVLGISWGSCRPDGTGAHVSAVLAEQDVAEQLPDADTCALLDRLAAELGLSVTRKKNGRSALVRADGTDVQPWRENYPYAERLGGKTYASVKRSLQIELLKLQRSVKASGDRLLIIFEGRDAAGKGGTIRRFTENLNPRGARIVALEKPAAHEQGEIYLRRYLPHLPAAGEIVMFDRSWYNRAGVEQVMGFCQPQEYAQFLRDAPEFERALVSDGITVVKFWFSVTRAEQLRRFIDRQVDPVKRWKLSQIDLASLDKWDEYTRAKEAMFRHTDLPEAPWTVVKSNDKRRARVEAMRYVLSLFDYSDKRDDIVGQPDPLIAGPVRAMPELPPEDCEPVAPPVKLSRVSLPRERVASRLSRSIRLTGPEPASSAVGLAEGALIALQADIV
jgi:polyphosphate kinase 2